jgi:hypothetical protein
MKPYNLGLGFIQNIQMVWIRGCLTSGLGRNSSLDHATHHLR